MFYTNYVNLCKKQGMSASGVANKLGFTNASVHGWKNGSVPKRENLEKIAEYFGVTVGDLLDESQEQEQKQEVKFSDFMKVYELLSDDRKKMVCDYMADALKEQLKG